MGTGPKLPSHSSSPVSVSDSRDRKVGQFGICHGYFQHPHLYYTASHPAKWGGVGAFLPDERYTCYLWGSEPTWGVGQAQEAMEGSAPPCSAAWTGVGMKGNGQEASCICPPPREAKAEQSHPWTPSCCPCEQCVWPAQRLSNFLQGNGSEKLY